MASENKVLVIDNDLRTIKLPSGMMHIGVAGDKEVNRLYFRMPRHYGGFDLSQFDISINYFNAIGDGDVAIAEGVVVSGDGITFSWLVDEFMTLYSGTVRLNVHLEKKNGSTVEKEFNTTYATSRVLENLNPTGSIANKFPSIVEKLKEDLFSRFDGKIDPTLKYSGMAADAAVTGNKIKKLEYAVSSPYNFKGSRLYSELPSSAMVNDTYYCTDKKCRYTWNGSGWYQSSMNESDYADELTSISTQIESINHFSSYKPGGYTSSAGMYVENESYSDSELVPLVSGGKIVIFYYPIESGLSSHLPISGINVYDENKEWLKFINIADLNPKETIIDAQHAPHGRESSKLEFTLDENGMCYWSTYLSNMVWNQDLVCYIGSEDGNKKLKGTIPMSAIYFDKKISRKHIESDDLDEPWSGKKWYAFGTSITDTSFINVETGTVTGKFVPYLTELSGLVVYNHGIAGGCIATGGIHGASGNILTRILSTDISDADLITIEGFVNDYACAVSIGEITDVENTTVCGALYQAIKYCLENSNATVVLLTETYGKEYTLASTGNTANYTIARKNSANLLQKDYNDAVKKMGDYMGVRVIDAGTKSQINEMHPEYIIDQIHHTELGGKQYAHTIWDELKNIHRNNSVTI